MSHMLSEKNEEDEAKRNCFIFIFFLSRKMWKSFSSFTFCQRLMTFFWDEVKLKMGWVAVDWVTFVSSFMKFISVILKLIL